MQNSLNLSASPEDSVITTGAFGASAGPSAIDRTCLSRAERKPEGRNSKGAPAKLMGEASDAITEITSDAKALADSYIELIKFDLRQELADARDAAVLLVGVALATACVILLASGSLALALVEFTAVPLWGAFAMVTVLASGLMIWAALSAKKRLGKVNAPPSLEEAKDDAKWIAEEV